VDIDGGRVGVSGAGVAGSFDAVAVVAGSFDHARVAAVAPLRVELAGDLGEDAGQDAVDVLRGENPPYRWRYGGRCAEPG
jgi:hypothetical protein